MQGDLGNLVQIQQSFKQLLQQIYFYLEKFVDIKDQNFHNGRQQDKNNTQVKSTDYLNFDISSPFYITNFQHFLNVLNKRYWLFIRVKISSNSQELQQWSIILFYDTVQQADLFSAPMIECIQRTFPFLEVLFTIYKENDWVEDTILITLFQNQNLILEQEYSLDIYSLDKMIRTIETFFYHYQHQSDEKQESIRQKTNQSLDYVFPPQTDQLQCLINNYQEENLQNHYSSLLRQKGEKRRSTFGFKIQMGGEFHQPKNEIPVYKGKKSDEEVNFQMLREQQFLDKYHQKNINCFDLDYEALLLSIVEQNDFLDEEEKNKVIGYYQQGNQRLGEILDKYNKTRDINSIKQDVMDLVLLGNSKRFEEISSPANFELFEPKIQKLKNFRFLINYYYEIDKVFTFKQIKTLYYLYVTEDISILAAYEVYCENKDQEEFIQTLTLVYKIYSLGNYIDLDFDEIEQFDELIEQQLNILFTYRRFFTLDQRSSLEKVIHFNIKNLRAGDNTLLKFFKEFMRIKNQEQFIDQTRQFADSRGAELKRIEMILIDRRQKRDEQKNENKELIEKLHSQFMKNKVRQVDLLLDALDKDSLLLKSSLEVYKYNLDKQDLVENLVLIYNQIYKANVKTMLKSLTIELQLSKPNLTNLLKKIDQDDPILNGAFELYYITKDELELKDTIQRMLKLNQQ